MNASYPPRDATRRQVKPVGQMMEGDEPDWTWLSSLLTSGSAISPLARQHEVLDEIEYFPGRETMPMQAGQELQGLVTEISG